MARQHGWRPTQEAVSTLSHSASPLLAHGFGMRFLGLATKRGKSHAPLFPPLFAVGFGFCTRPQPSLACTPQSPPIPKCRNRFKACDLVCVPSRNEPFGTALKPRGPNRQPPTPNSQRTIRSAHTWNLQAPTTNHHSHQPQNIIPPLTRNQASSF